MYAEGPREIQSHGIEAKSIEALADIALGNLYKQGMRGIVCGPITTGGTNHQIYNLEIFNATIRGLIRRGERIFDQMPYEFGLRRLANAWHDAGNSGYYTPILTVFYTRLFASGLITPGWFIPGYSSSFGARFEREKLTAHGAVIVDLTREEIRQFMLAEHPPEHVEKVLSLMAA